MTLEARLWVASLLCLIAFFVLGYALSHAGALWRIDVEAAALRGQATPLAAIFTASGRAVPLALVAIAAVAAAIATRFNPIAAVAIVAVQALSQGAVELAKDVFVRARPDAWLIRLEQGYSYPSGHAATAIIFFGSWLVLIAASGLPRDIKIPIAVVLAIWIVGIDWSRLALGAHFATDVIGGTLFGTAWACALWAVLVHFRLAPVTTL